ncbi:hypothetical protein HPB50_011476 [Hyalomma asiaticum]|uniref:Uncharacterized protein n=1 Tax=Hyalomma asiaticum TaxID=266040 RepID=A0ACB7SLT3_HYAAI|nr:hypothetical protein HPB50_011476 [Hyalomma asiaticum]
MIAIDNIVLNDTGCGKDITGGCDFEADSCGWELNNWEHARGRDNPVADHTTESLAGRFALAKSPGGRMVSPQSWYDATKSKMLRFWFYLTGTSAETLEVIRVLKDGQETKLWSGTPFESNSGQWHQASINLPAYKETPTIVFDGETSGGQNTIVAVDDISLADEPCPSPGSCSFEEDLCGWFNKEGPNRTQWYRHRGATFLNTTGVEEDHTLGTAKGYYLLLDAGDFASSHYGSLQSQTLSLGPTVCFSLYYSMGQTCIANTFRNMQILPELVRSMVREETQWMRLDEAAPILWPLADMVREKVIIIGSTARGRTDLMIDDIDVRSGTCDGITTTTKAPKPEAPTVPTEVITRQAVTSETSLPTTSDTPEPVSSEIPMPPEPRPVLACRRGEFSCREDNTCIPAELLCDGVNDCPNGLDEKCGAAMRCKENEFFCTTGSPRTCMPRSLLCDGHEDCAGGSDESLCRTCPNYLCQNGGTCGWTPKAPSPTCDCRDGYEGRRCNLLANTASRVGNMPSKDSASPGGAVTGVVVVLVILAITAAGVAFVVMRRRRNPQSTPVFLNNPSYDASTDETSP